MAHGIKLLLYLEIQSKLFRVFKRRVSDRISVKALTSDWSANSFMMVSMRIFFKVQLEFSIQSTTKNFS